MRPVDRRYFYKWREACQARGWKASDESIRHAMHRAALGREESHTLFNDADFDRVFAFIDELIDPDNLDAVMRMQAFVAHDTAQAAHEPVIAPGKPKRKSRGRRAYASQYEHTTAADDPGERKRRVYVISRLFPERLIEERSRDLFDRADWQELPLPDLTLLRDTLKSRLKKWLTKVKAGAIEYEFPFSIKSTNPRSTSGLMTNEEIITELLRRGVPVDTREGLTVVEQHERELVEEPF